MRVGIDFSASMVHRARALHPELDIRTGDAHALAFGDATFDVVASNFGVLHFAEPERFFGEAYRVLRPGGRLGFTVWADVAGEVFSLINGAISTLGLPISLPDGRRSSVSPMPVSAAPRWRRPGSRQPRSR